MSLFDVARVGISIRTRKKAHRIYHLSRSWHSAIGLDLEFALLKLVKRSTRSGAAGEAKN